MTRALTIFVCALALSLGLASAAPAEPGGKAADKRSDKAADRSNAQWQRDAARGKDNAEVRKRQADEMSAELERAMKDQEKAAAEKADDVVGDVEEAAEDAAEKADDAGTD